MSDVARIYCDTVPSSINVVITIIGLILTLICISLYIKGINIVCKSSNLTPKSMVITYNITLICWIFVLFVRNFRLIFQMTSMCHTINNNTFKYIEMFYKLGSAFYWFGISNSYLLFVFRLKYSFISTTQKLSLCLFIILIGFYIVQTLLGIRLCAALITFVHYRMYTPFFQSGSQILLYISVLCYIIPSIILIVLYVKKSVRLAKNSKFKNSHDVQRCVLYVSTVYTCVCIYTYIQCTYIYLYITYHIEIV